MSSSNFRLFRRCKRLTGKLCVLLWLSVIGVMPAWAGSGTCTLTSPGSPMVANVRMSGSITAGRDAPIGTELARVTFWDNTPINFSCTAGTFNVVQSYATVPAYGQASISGPFGGGVVYNTHIPGIGVYAWINSAAVPITGGPLVFATPGNQTLMGGPSGSNSMSAFTSFDISFIKTAATVGTGTLTAADLPTLRFALVGSTSTVYETQVTSGSINVIARTCTTPPVDVDLDTHYTTELKGVDSTTAWVNVPIVLKDCPAFYGSANSRYNQAKSPPIYENVTTATNAIFYNVTPTTSVVLANQGVMALQSGGAAGIGIQMGDGKGNPLSYSKVYPSGLTLTTVDGASYTINLQARYYQTSATPTPGQANGAATVTLIYL